MKVRFERPVIWIASVRYEDTVCRFCTTLLDGDILTLLEDLLEPCLPFHRVPGFGLSGPFSCFAAW